MFTPYIYQYRHKEETAARIAAVFLSNFQKTNT